jgi:hypothetical protein
MSPEPDPSTGRLTLEQRSQRARAKRQYLKFCRITAAANLIIERLPRLRVMPSTAVSSD